MMKSRKAKIFILLLFFIAGSRQLNAQFVRGADIGWLSQMEATGYKFYDTNNVQMDCLDILQSRGINTVRLRLFVNPSNNKTSGHCSKKEVAVMALRAKNRGMRVMIDFHYSDSWADPGQQTKPAAWASHTFSQLLDDLYNHTYDVIDTLKSIGATPDWVQIGNEIAGGMLWPDGSTSNWTQLAQLLNKGYDAVKAVDSNIKVIIHLEGGNDNYKCRTFFDNATIRNVRYDIIGLSYYPYWIGSDYTETIDDLGYNMNDLVARYGKKVMVVEVGGLFNQVQNTYDMLIAVFQKVMAVPGNKGLGVIYWEPEGEKTWSGYGLSCWNAGGKPTRALNAFLYGLYTGIDEEVPSAALRIYPNPNFSGILNIESSDLKGPAEIDIGDISGQRVKTIQVNDLSKASIDLDLPSGTYILRISWPNGTIYRKLILY